jgi:ABC-2 type transport system ATP-binding protein
MAFITQAPSDQPEPDQPTQVTASQRNVQVEPPVIQVKNLTKRFRDEFAVQDISFDIPKGTIFGFIGPSGSGKTTTIRMLNGVYRPSEGSVTVFGVPPTKFGQKLRSQVGYMPQLFVLYPNLTVWENLSFTASLYGMGLIRGKRLREALEFVELYEHRNKLARNISGGMQRRLSLASTLLHDPDLIYLDEPTAGIDPVLRRKFWDHFKELQNAGKTIFVTTQYVNEASYCDVVGVMSNGKLLTVDSPQGLRYSAYHGEMVDLTTKEPIDWQLEHQLMSLGVVKRILQRTGPNSMRLLVHQAGTAVPELMEWSQAQNLTVESLEEYLPPFDDVFVELIEKDEQNG